MKKINPICVKCDMPYVAIQDEEAHPLWWCTTCDKKVERVTSRKKWANAFELFTKRFRRWWYNSSDYIFPVGMIIGVALPAIVGIIVSYQPSKLEKDPTQTWMVFYDRNSYKSAPFVAKLLHEALVDGEQIEVLKVNTDFGFIKIKGKYTEIQHTNSKLATSTFMIESHRLANPQD